MEAKCTFGLLLEDECHKHSYSRQTGLKSLSELSDDSCEVYLWRAGLLDKVDCKFEGTICLHHEYVFRTKYEEKEKKCCNLFKKHKKKAVGSLTLKLELAKQLKDKGISVVPGSKLCRNCDEMVISEEKTESREGKPLQPEDPDPTSKEEEDFELSSREREQLEKRYKEGSTVPGTRSYHFYEPVPNREMAVRYKRVSEDNEYCGEYAFKDMPVLESQVSAPVKYKLTGHSLIPSNLT
eukprot:gene2703-915_t